MRLVIFIRRGKCHPPFHIYYFSQPCPSPPLWNNKRQIIINADGFLLADSFHKVALVIAIDIYDNPQYGLSKSQSFVVYSMLKISDVTDSGRQ
jgi:hypothetical protein